jgi:hypothetical protein
LPVSSILLKHTTTAVAPSTGASLIWKLKVAVVGIGVLLVVELPPPPQALIPIPQNIIIGSTASFITDLRFIM